MEKEHTGNQKFFLRFGYRHLIAPVCIYEDFIIKIVDLLS